MQAENRHSVVMIDLKEQAQRVGVSQVSLAARVGVSEPTMSRWLKRTIHIPTRYLRPMSVMLCVPVEALLPPEPSRRRRAA